MFKDKEEALRRLEVELLREEEEELQEAEDEWEEQPEDWEEEESEDWEEEEVYLEVHAYNSDRLDEDLEDFSRQVYDPDRQTGARWVAAGAMIALAAVLLVLAFFAARYLGR